MMYLLCWYIASLNKQPPYAGVPETDKSKCDMIYNINSTEEKNMRKGYNHQRKFPSQRGVEAGGCYELVVLIEVLVVVYCLLDIDVFGYAICQCQHYYGDMVHLCVLANFVLVGVSLKLVVLY
jgi:hypothetical protein